MIHHKPPPKMLIANMMPKFALNQMQGRGEESISPLSFHSNSSSSSNLSYQKRYQDGGNGGNDGYSNSRYYYNKYKNQDEIGGGGGGSSSRIIYKTTGANTSNGNSIRFLKKAYSSKYENQEESTGSALGLISNKNILDNASRVITAADYRNTKKKMFDNDEGLGNDAKEGGNDKKMPSDEANNNNNNSNNQKSKPNESERLSEVNANDLTVRNDLNNKKLPDDITNHLDDMFNDMSLNSLLDDKITDERESSRFSKWFNMSNADGGEEKDSKNNSSIGGNNNSAMFSIQETEKYFQPIDKMENNSLFNFAQRQQPTAQKSQKSPGSSGSSGQVHSLEELEANLRHNKSDEERKVGGESEGEKKVLQNFFQQQFMTNLMQSPPQQPQMQQQQQQHQQSHQNQEEINAFKKLLSQITPEERKISPQMMPGGGPNVLQQLMFQKGGIPMGKAPGGGGKIMNPPHMMPPQQPPFGGNLQQPKIPSPGGPHPEIIKRPEVQALLQGKLHFGFCQRKLKKFEYF
jgi:hypothetical protein